MVLLKVFIGILLLVALTLQKPQTSRFKSANARSLNPNATTVHYCNIKAYSRTLAVFNLGFTLHQPVKPVYMEIFVDYKYGTIYRQIVRTDPIDGCAVLDGTDKNPLLSMVIDIFRDSAKGAIHSCPYQGRNDFQNLSFSDQKILSIVPSGIYRVQTIFKTQETSLLNVNLTYEIDSDIKTSF